MEGSILEVRSDTQTYEVVAPGVPSEKAGVCRVIAVYDNGELRTGRKESVAETKSGIFLLVYLAGGIPLMFLLAALHDVFGYGWKHVLGAFVILTIAVGFCYAVGDFEKED